MQETVASAVSFMIGICDGRLENCYLIILILRTVFIQICTKSAFCHIKKKGNRSVSYCCLCSFNYAFLYVCHPRKVRSVKVQL